MLNDCVFQSHSILVANYCILGHIYLVITMIPANVTHILTMSSTLLHKNVSVSVLQK